MPSIASFSKILGIVIYCQWMMFCSSDENRALPASLPAPLGRSRSCDSSNTNGELYLLTERRGRRSSLTVVGIAVVNAYRDLPPLYEPLPTGSAASSSLALDLPGDGGRDEPDSSPPGSPTKRIALSLPNADMRPDDLLRLAVHVDAVTARNIRALFVALAMAINETKENVNVLRANAESSCREALDQGFNWGAISARDVAADGLEYLPLAEWLVKCINTPKLALRYCLKDPEADLNAIGMLLASVKESDERTIRETLGSVFVLHKLPRHDGLKDLIERMIKYSNDPSSALEICIKPGIHLETFKARLENAIMFSKRKLEETRSLNDNLAILSILYPTLPAATSLTSSDGEA